MTQGVVCPKCSMVRAPALAECPRCRDAVSVSANAPDHDAQPRMSSLASLAFLSAVPALWAACAAFVALDEPSPSTLVSITGSTYPAAVACGVAIAVALPLVGPLTSVARRFSTEVSGGAVFLACAAGAGPLLFLVTHSLLLTSDVEGLDGTSPVPLRCGWHGAVPSGPRTDSSSRSSRRCAATRLTVGASTL